MMRWERDRVTLQASHRKMIASWLFAGETLNVDPQIFVMDEATSSVDINTERAIQSAIDRIIRNRISFVIAHRLSTIKSASRILVVEAGKIIEDGSHQALIRRRGHYCDLYTNQFTHEREEAALQE
jgi:ATP-binding cassette subfamily B protein